MAPTIEEFLCADCRAHLDQVREILEGLAVPFVSNPRLVRGLDYYTRTTFEILGHTLGAQNALLGGGRYDGLVKALGGPDRTGIGFAAGLERLVLAMPEGAAPRAPAGVFVVAVGEESRVAGLKLLRDLRQAGVPAQMEFEARSLKAQLKRADRIAARATFIIGGDELARGEVTVRDMRASTQHSVPLAGAIAAARALIE
jgi:histidyl-tRNA synthetase